MRALRGTRMAVLVSLLAACALAAGEGAVPGASPDLGTSPAPGVPIPEASPAPAGTPLPTAAPSPGEEGTVLGTVDPRSEGEGPGLVGSPLVILLGVVGLGLFSAVVTALFVRLTRQG